MSRLLLTVAMAAEAGLLLEHMRSAPSLGGRPTYVGKVGGRLATLVLTGMGAVCAAQAATAALERLPDVVDVINLGCAGAYASGGMRVGQAAVADRVVLADMGVEAGGRVHGLEKTGIPLGHDLHGEPIYNIMRTDPELSGALASTAPQAERGAFATVGRVSGDPETADRVAARWEAILEEMEAAAVALVAAHYGLPFAAVRGISNLAGDRALDVAAGAEAAQRVLLAMETHR